MTQSRLQEASRQSPEKIGIRNSQYLNNRVEQDRRQIKLRVQAMLSFKSFLSATATLAGTEMVHMMRKRQGHFAFKPAPTLKEQFEAIAAWNGCGQ